MDQTLQIILGVVAIIAAVGGFLIWHFKEMHKIKEEVKVLELKMKDLEHRDNLQQQTIDQLNTLYPLIKKAFENLNTNKK